MVEVSTVVAEVNRVMVVVPRIQEFAVVFMFLLVLVVAAVAATRTLNVADRTWRIQRA